MGDERPLLPVDFVVSELSFRVGDLACRRAGHKPCTQRTATLIHNSESLYSDCSTQQMRQAYKQLC